MRATQVENLLLNKNKQIQLMIFKSFLGLKMKMNHFKLKLSVKSTFFNCPRLENALQPLFRVYVETIYDKTNA